MMKRNRGIVLVLIILILSVSFTFILLASFNYLINSQRDFLFSKYYERAIASALSCREVAMARLNLNFLYTANDINISDHNCHYSVIFDHTLKDVYINIFSTSTIDIPRFIYPKNIIVSIKSTVQISHVGPNVIKTIFQ